VRGRRPTRSGDSRGPQPAVWALAALVVGFICITVLVTSLLDAGHLAIGGSRTSERRSSGPATAAVTSTVQAPPAASSTTTVEEETPAIPPAKGKALAAGDPERVAREFALRWINRPSDPTVLREQNGRLIALSIGPLGDQIGATLSATTGSGSRGIVVGFDVLRRGARQITALVTTREQLAPGGRAAEPYHYALYLTRLQRVAGGGFAVSSWEPQI
jgi:hypothetical protein